jgi:hypothetical protein
MEAGAREAATETTHWAILTGAISISEGRRVLSGLYPSIEILETYARIHKIDVMVITLS